MAVIKTYQSVSYIGKDGSSPIYVSFYLERKKIVLPTGISVKTSNFDNVTGKIKTGEKNHKDCNLVIEKVRSRVNDIMVKYRLEKKVLTKDLFLKEYNRPTDFKTFYDYFRHYIKEHPNEIEPTTLDVHIDAMNKLKAYAPNLQIVEITEDFVEEYKIYLKKKLKNCDSTINKNLACIKKYIRKAIKAGYISHNPFENIKISRRLIGKFSFLTEEELQLFIDLYKNKTLTPGQQKILQFFLFLCFSSLHVSDAKALRIEQFGAKTFTYYRIKNRNSKPAPIIVPISHPLRKLLRDIIGKRKFGLVFESIIADQKINEGIKRIAKNTGIMKDLSCKSGRHTFATIFLKNTKDLVTLKEILGHSDYRETLIYAHVLEESKLEGIKSFDSFRI